MADPLFIFVPSTKYGRLKRTNSNSFNIKQAQWYPRIKRIRTIQSNRQYIHPINCVCYHSLLK